MITKTYHIQSNLGFIGFILISDNSQFIHGHILLFETVELNGNKQMVATMSQQSSYSLGALDIAIIQDLMLKAIPNFRNTGLTYSAIDTSGKRFTI